MGADRNDVFIIAEAGVNHNGSIDTARELIDVAVESGADAVKFQTFKAENLVNRSALKAEYQRKTTDPQESQYGMLKKLELDYGSFRDLYKYCETKQIRFLSTPFDNESIDFLDQLGMEIFKIPSGEITNLPYLRSIGKLGKDVILSTGMANLDEVGDALKVLVSAGLSKEQITVLHATTEYPCPYDEVNLRAMVTIRETFGVEVGYSDHTPGLEVPVSAVALGAKVIEKHFTIDRAMDGPDHKASLEPNELKLMVSSIRNVEKALGDGIKKPTPAEIKNMAIARKSIVARTDIKKGELFSPENITVKRPGTGISPMRWDDIIGSAAGRDYKEEDLL